MSNPNEQGKTTYEDFLLELLKVVADSEGDKHIVHQFFDGHLTYLNENLLAIFLQQVEMLLEREKEPEQKSSIASRLNSLAIDLYQFPRGNRSINRELSIICCEAALLEYTREQFPIEWAITQMNQAIAYSTRIEGEHRENLERAIRGYDLALLERTRERFPIEWAKTQINRAIAFRNRVEGERRENIEEAIRCYDSALLELTRERFPIEWATTQNNRATAYRNRIEGEQRENLEEAIRGYDLALLERTREKLPIQWGITHMNRAIAYTTRIEGTRSENLEEAIRSYDLALLERARERFPIEWAMTHMNRAIAYRNRIEGEQQDNLEEAIRGYDLALLEYTREKLPIEWATTHMNRATAYRNRIKGEHRENLEEAIRGYDLALLERTREKLPIEWATTIENLAILHAEENEKLAIDLYHQTLEVFTSASLPIDAFTVNRGLGNIYFKQGSWQLAINAYEAAMQAVETSRSWVINEDSRQQLLQDALAIYENAIQCAINLGNYPQAIQFTERIRSRQLVDLMGTKDLYSDAEIPVEIQQYLNEYEQLNREIQRIREHGTPCSDGTTTTTRNAASLSRDNTAIQALEEQKRAQYLKIRAFDPAIAGQIAVEPIDFTAIQKLITTPHAAILTCYSTDDDTHVFIIKQGQQPMLYTCNNQGCSELQYWLLTEWISPYHNDNSIWQQNLPTLLAEISQRLQLDTLIEQHLTDITELIIVPHLNLHQIPFAALPINPTPTESSKNPLLGGVPVGRGGSFLGDKFIIRSIPSCQILQYCQQRDPITDKHIGTVEDAQDNLLGARYEGEQIAALYSIPTTNRLRGSTQATVANYRELLTRVNRIHSSHHAISRPDNPIESALILANGERITLGDLLLGKRYRDTLDEVFLSACETHVGTATLTDDVATLTTGFLCIGARSVQSTLWSVDDLVTALFDIFYHQERRDGVNRALSLQAAQVRLRNLTGAEFKISHYPKLKAFIDGYCKPALARLEARMDELDLAKKTPNQEEQIKINEEYRQLEELHTKIGEAPKILKKYCQQQQPFESPYYWGAFTCQGMA
jgi:CHAT domain-containing protein